MKPLASLSSEVARSLTGLFFDLDDTVLTRGVLTLDAYRALWSLHEAGLHLVAVTGRPSGWGEVVARQWPIDGAITENGAAHVVREGEGVSVVVDGDAATRAVTRQRLDELVREVSARVPEARLSDDVHARITDVTWDIGERQRLPPDRVAAIVAVATERGARTTRSSVHVHASYERDDKASGAVRFAHVRFGEDAGAALVRWAFVGDSGNDAPCFGAFRTTFGVANVRSHLQHLAVPPRFVARQERGAGFAEIAAAILARR